MLINIFADATMCRISIFCYFCPRKHDKTTFKSSICTLSKFQKFSVLPRPARSARSSQTIKNSHHFFNVSYTCYTALSIVQQQSFHNFEMGFMSRYQIHVPSRSQFGSPAQRGARGLALARGLPLAQLVFFISNNEQGRPRLSIRQKLSTKYSRPRCHPAAGADMTSSMN